MRKYDPALASYISKNRVSCPRKPMGLIFWKSNYTGLLHYSWKLSLIKIRQNVLYHFVAVIPITKQKPLGFENINGINDKKATFSSCTE